MLTKPTLTLLFLLYLSLAIAKPSLTRAKSATNRNLPLLNAYASNHGNVHLHQDPYGGYYGYVDFQYSPSEDSDQDNTVPDAHTGAMTISLYSSQTWLGNNTCMNFTTYDCQANSCTPFPSWKEVSETLPYMKATGYYASAPVYLDYKYWSLSSSAVITNSCISGVSNAYGSERIGILGMGLANGSTSNFHSGQLFSIYLDKSSDKGQLQFDIDHAKISSNSSSYSLTADANWHIPLGYTYIQFKEGQTTWTYYMIVKNLIFDLEYSAIGIPYDSYKAIITDLTNIGNFSCTNALAYPACQYDGTLGDLPTLSIYIQNQYITIPPQVYILNALTYNESKYISNMNLNFRALSPKLSTINYVTEDYDSTIILGTSFMTYYYTVFQGAGTTPKVDLYVAAVPSPTPTPTPVPPTPSNKIDYYVLFGIACFVALLICVVCICRGCKSKKINTGKKVASTDFAASSFQAPLIPNADAVNAAYTQLPPSYGSNTYNSCPQQPQFQPYPVGVIPDGYTGKYSQDVPYGVQHQGQYNNTAERYNAYQEG